MGFVEVSARLEQHCHSEPVRTLVWESPSKFGLLFVIQSVLFWRFPVSIHEKWYVYPGDCHTRKADWFAMTGNSSNSNLSFECVNPISTLSYISYRISYILSLSRLYIFRRASPVRAGNVPGQKISVFLPNTLDKIQIRRYSMMCLYLETFPESGKCRSGENTANPFGTKILS